MYRENFNKIASLAEEDFSVVCEKKNECDKNIHNDFTGYMPQRKDFEIEYENDVENYLADLEFFDDDRPDDVLIKLKQIEVYQKVLDEREERKKFVIERWPLEVKHEKKIKNNVFEKNVYSSLKPFARLLSFEKHVNFCEALKWESLLKMKLEELKIARLKGIKTEDDFRKYLLHKKNSNADRAKEYDTLAKEEFYYKAAEIQKNEVLRDLEGSYRGNGVENDFLQMTGLSPTQFCALKDKIAGNMQAKFSQIRDDKIDDCKKEFIDFIVKYKGNC